MDEQAYGDVGCLIHRKQTGNWFKNKLVLFTGANKVDIQLHQ